MADHASTDEIAKAAYEASRNHWKEFIGFPVVVSIGFFIIVSVIAWLTFNVNDSLSGLFILIYIGFWVFWMAYMAAQMKWCEELHGGAQSLDLKEGLRYGLSRFWGFLGTSLLTGIKVFLWMLLLFIPGYYKGVMYSKSVHVSVLDKVSGGDANRVSTAIIKKAGPIRTFSNMMGIIILAEVAFMIIYLLAIVVGGIFGYVNEYLGFFVGGIAGTMSLLFIMSVTMLYFHFEYLYFRDEAKTEIASLKKALANS